MPGDKGLIQDVRPASAEITGQQRELFAFDAFEYEDPNKIPINEDAKITLKTGWKFDLQRADITGSLDMLGQGAIQSENYVEDVSGWRIDSTSIEIDEGTFRGDITGGTISIGGTPGNPNFSVDSAGNMVAVGGTFEGAVDLGTADFTTTGNISVTNITASNSISVTAGNISATGNITATGNLAGANFFAMNQNVRTTDNVTFETVTNSGQTINGNLAMTGSMTSGTVPAARIQFRVTTQAITNPDNRTVAYLAPAPIVGASVTGQIFAGSIRGRSNSTTPRFRFATSHAQSFPQSGTIHWLRAD